MNVLVDTHIKPKYIIIVVIVVVCSLFNNIVSNDWMIVNWKGWGRKWSYPNLRCHPGIFLERLRKIHKEKPQLG
jgi:hypothetical protein